MTCTRVSDFYIRTRLAWGGATYIYAGATYTRTQMVGLCQLLCEDYGRRVIC